jgi:hypothetical protein
MSVLLMPPPVPDADRSRRELTRTCAAVRAAIEAATTAPEAFSLWVQCRALLNDLQTLTLRAELRCKELEARAQYMGVEP